MYQTIKRVSLKAIPVIKINNMELISFSAIFVSLAVALPWLTHQFSLTGPMFLPMHFFVLVAALVFGWKAGIIVGLLTPIISYITSGMPMISVLPQVIIEIMIYGFVAGYCREKIKLNIYLSLILAMIIGRLGLLLAISFISVSSFGPLAEIWKVLSIAWPGILLQLALIPITANWLSKFIEKRRQI